jgi:hypothetical protein
LQAAIAQSQKARNVELRAALSLAKLYRAANRDADAHAMLAPTSRASHRPDNSPNSLRRKPFLRRWLLTRRPCNSAGGPRAGR